MEYIACVVLVLAIWLQVRNLLILRVLLKVLKTIKQEARTDIDNGRPWEWRYQDYDKRNYAVMLFTLWRRPSWFWKNAACLKPSGYN